MHCSRDGKGIPYKAFCIECGIREKKVFLSTCDKTLQVHLLLIYSFNYLRKKWNKMGLTNNPFFITHGSSKGRPFHFRMKLSLEKKMTHVRYWWAILIFRPALSFLSFCFLSFYNFVPSGTVGKENRIKGFIKHDTCPLWTPGCNIATRDVRVWKTGKEKHGKITGNRYAIETRISSLTNSIKFFQFH